MSGSVGKESACKAGDTGFNSWVGKIPWRRKRLSTPVLWPGGFHDTDTTEGLSLSLHIQGTTFIKVVEVVASQEFPEIIYRIWHETVHVYFFLDRCL